MKTIYKYHIKTGMEWPIGAEILDVENNHDGICIWVLCDPEKPMKKRDIRFFPTGDMVPEVFTYLKTVHLIDAGLVWHVFLHAEDFD